MSEVEVLKISEFKYDKTYSTALRTRVEGYYPNAKHYTTNELRYLGKYIETVRSGGFSDGSRVVVTFEEGVVELDYHGRTCFIEHDIEHD